MGTVRSGRPRTRRVGLLAVQGATLIVAALFLAAGIAGFIPGLTSHLDQLRWQGESSRAQLFGVFDISVVHNLVHLVFGVAGLILARTYARARTYLIGGGFVFLGLWLYSLLSDAPDRALPLNNADNWLHLSVGVVMILLGLTLAGSKVPTGAEGEILIPPE
ncbi:MAG: DUF4383 domain-containing protein [Mycolicibacterium sp.]|jgi:hypothetical protein|nr:DUF4383 domain-containing protein [Mycobacterium sp.]MCB0939048.1 DUF4383 domain-containing protein [Mycobacterium sp.]MCB9415869.1 DUF4383 domain-containing protein [Mycolicibacterium sp.]HNM95472.1 DUF4383 domain-containing protein [Mycobacterium sp.]